MKNVIIADDEILMRNVLRRLIKKTCGTRNVLVSIEEVPNGEELVAKVTCAEKDFYKLILTDYRMMGNISGLEAVEQIRRSNPIVPVYLMSANEVMEKAMQAGATGYIQKPFDSKSIQDIVSNHLFQD